MIRQTLSVAASGLLVVSVGYGAGRLSAISEPALARWDDGVLALEVRVQEDLTVVATVTNRSSSKQVVPAFDNLDLINESGVFLRLDGPFADWQPEELPVLELAPGRSYSEATDLLRLFPSLTPGQYTILVRYSAAPGSRTTWHGSADVPAISLRVRRLVDDQPREREGNLPRPTSQALPL